MPPSFQITRGKNENLKNKNKINTVFDIKIGKNKIVIVLCNKISIKVTVMCYIGSKLKSLLKFTCSVI